ncbi:DUF6261 family protein [Ferruginibacter albus]|uniref:DUF6261 family protein n=1 Tax=Ferruginibacter albus TaxID=2875540 RepID=UPI001CC3C0D6|nr:DUF6261 family protein [Ferruginibacter albus]UAY52888.1 hypothetical protein K9M53_04215 [Ferruginibacter albus]
MSIISIDITKLRNSEFLQFSKDLLEIIKQNDPATLKVTEQYNSFNNITTEIDGLFKTPTGSALTQDITDLDIRRDNAITGINTVIQALSYHFNSDKAAAANLLAFHLKNYGAGIAKENYQSETAIIDNITADWSTKPDLAAAINTLKLNEWADELSAANKAFNELYIDRTKELAAVNPDTIKIKRLEAVQLYYALRDVIDAWYTINKGAAPFDKVTQECNALIDQYNTLIAGRKAGTTDNTAPETSTTNQ